VTLKEEHRLRVFEKREQIRIFGPKRDEERGGWRKLHNEELHNLYYSPRMIRMIKSRRMRLVERVARMGERYTYRLVVGKPEGKGSPGRPKHRWVGNIEMDLRRDRMMCVSIGTDGELL
jgi:hypothetical protein